MIRLRRTPAYFVSQSHGFNSVHGRMASVTTGANAANRDLTYIGVSGDGDSLSIGMGQFAHIIRRNLDMCYLIENNGVYGLTKGQYSASADVGSTAKKGPANRQMPIDPVSTAIGLVQRSRRIDQKLRAHARILPTRHRCRFHTSGRGNRGCLQRRRYNAGQVARWQPNCLPQGEQRV